MTYRTRASVGALLTGLTLLAACTSNGGTTQPRHERAASGHAGPQRADGPARRVTAVRPAGRFTVSFAGDVHFSGRVRARLDRNPSTVFGQAAPVLRRADLTMVNLETAITRGGVEQNKLFTFRAPPRAFVALRRAGIDVATMANNHGADYGTPGIRDSLAAIRRYHFPVVGIGADARHAYAPYKTTLNGVKVAIIGADQVQDETTLRLFSAGPGKPGVANAYRHRLITTVRRAKAAGYVVIVYLHWGIEYDTCPSSDQTRLAQRLARSGASAVIGTHAHVLQGAGWKHNGAYVAYGLGNYLWWLSFNNNQDDNGVLTLRFHRSKVVDAAFAPAHLDNRGVPVPARLAERRRIMAEWNSDRGCTGLSATPPR